MWAAQELTRAEWMAARDELRTEADTLTASPGQHRARPPTRLGARPPLI
jgi:hypothetical protein